MGITYYSVILVICSGNAYSYTGDVNKTFIAANKRQKNESK